jgi:hypothetical protein
VFVSGTEFEVHEQYICEKFKNKCQIFLHPNINTGGGGNNNKQQDWHILVGTETLHVMQSILQSLSARLLGGGNSTYMNNRAFPIEMIVSVPGHDAYNRIRGTYNNGVIFMLCTTIGGGHSHSLTAYALLCYKLALLLFCLHRIRL